MAKQAIKISVTADTQKFRSSSGKSAKPKAASAS